MASQANDDKDSSPLNSDNESTAVEKDNNVPLFADEHQECVARNSSATTDNSAVLKNKETTFASDDDDNNTSQDNILSTNQDTTVGTEYNRTISQDIVGNDACSFYDGGLTHDEMVTKNKESFLKLDGSRYLEVGSGENTYLKGKPCRGCHKRLGIELFLSREKEVYICPQALSSVYQCSFFYCKGCYYKLPEAHYIFISMSP